MTVFVAWFLFPVVLGLLALGCGLLLQAVAGIKLADGLVMPAGIAVIILVGEIVTKSSSLAPATPWIVVVLAVIGGVLARPWVVRPQISWWPIVIAFGVYFVYLAPVLLSGEPTFTGFIKLDDTSTWMGMTDQVLKTGHNIASLPPSTYEAMLGAYLTGGEPLGSMLPWGIANHIVGQDLAWEFQPYIAFLAGMISMVGWAIARPFIRNRALRGAVVFIAAQATLIYGYSLWGGIKEVAAALVLLVIAASIVPILESGARIRSFLPLGVAVFAMLGVNGYDGAVWVPATLLLVAVFALWTWVRERAWPQLAALGVAAVAFIVLAIHSASAATANKDLAFSNELGNLAHPVRPLQLLGVWPTADFRISPPNAPVLTYLLIAVVIVGLVFAAAVSWQERSWVLPVAFAGALVGVLASSYGGSPWIQGKAFATASPTFLLLGLIGLAALGESPGRLLPGRRRISRSRTGDGLAVGRGLALGACLAVAVGVIWGNALAYGHVTLAPYAQMAELSYIGQRFAGQGPTMINENEPYAGRHFLRLMDPEEPSDIRRRPVLLRSGAEVPTGGYADLDQFQIATLLVYRTIVMRTGPTASRPPAPYRLIYNGPWYQVWQRPTTLSRQIVDSIPLGGSLSPIAVPSCTQVARLAREVGPNGELAAAQRPASIGTNIPPNLKLGRTTQTFHASSPGTYYFWLGGGINGHLTTTVDGHQIGSTNEILNEPGGYIPLGKIHLAAGVHHFTLDYHTGGLAPGSAGPSIADPAFTVGPLVASTAPGNVPVIYVSPANYRQLCGRPWDWVEALGA
ncbi:MAG TPA: hypothetical protein VMD09_02020 [Solirubrobacteraceae bacterium]|nr:hypothetical protein [Solirubrobacteraceae bacterium]